MRVVIVGAGAVGGVVAGRLHQAGHQVTVVARGPHLDAIRADGLHVASPDGVDTLAVDAVGSPDEAELGTADVVFVAVKSQDTAAVAERMQAAAPDGLPIVSLQNGVENERVLLRRFDRVYGVCVMCPTSHHRPGVVMAHSTPITGILDIGRYPTGVDDTTRQVAAELAGATFLSEPRADIMRWKYTKLLMNLANAVEALCGPAARFGELARRARAEGIACLDAAGIPYASDEEDRARRSDHLGLADTAAGPWQGGSTWQSLARGTGATEVDHLNGEICLLGRSLGIPTPVNALLVRRTADATRTRTAPGTVDEQELLDVLRPA